MGQAKQRGTFLQRKIEGEARRIAEELRRREEEAAREAAMTPEEKAARRKMQMIIGFVAAITPPEVLDAAKFGRALFSLLTPKVSRPLKAGRLECKVRRSGSKHEQTRQSNSVTTAGIRRA